MEVGILKNVGEFIHWLTNHLASEKDSASLGLVSWSVGFLVCCKSVTVQQFKFYRRTVPMNEATLKTAHKLGD